MVTFSELTCSSGDPHGNRRAFSRNSKARLIETRRPQARANIVGNAPGLCGHAKEVRVRFSVAVQVMRDGDGIGAGRHPLEAARHTGGIGGNPDLGWRLAHRKGCPTGVKPASNLARGPGDATHLHRQVAGESRRRAQRAQDRKQAQLLHHRPPSRQCQHDNMERE
ncbi:hypothetical protein CC_2338 [Caulobacter vibrioides CB15]|uniref:Uncharacterized protein n=1 Tax=Caulobacter vibrioides (strain ATCC 19089 / CIP 103742 / CB 15) TaxID=190650 RepID=Q9A5V9_CAUVC|nr:hypothetical protein CC_2338 [Caulobacter vibrioides CB15]